jgi:hypothetical protein
MAFLMVESMNLEEKTSCFGLQTSNQEIKDWKKHSGYKGNNN